MRRKSDKFCFVYLVWALCQQVVLTLPSGRSYRRSYVRNFYPGVYRPPYVGFTVFYDSYDDSWNRDGTFADRLNSTRSSQARITNIERWHDPGHLLTDFPDNVDYRPPDRSGTRYEYCVCVPLYLCSRDRVASGGLTLAALVRRSRSIRRNSNKVKEHPGKMLIEIFAPYREHCGSESICCRLTNRVEEYPPDFDEYPIATPIPDNMKPQFDRSESHGELCGVRHAYGVRGRLADPPYPKDKADYGEYPWHAALLKSSAGARRGQNLYLCGGVLISHQWVATAAHCLKHATASELRVRLGEWDVEREDEIYPYVEADVDTVIVHPKFSPTDLQNDVALVRMHRQVDLQFPHITAACLPDMHQTFQGKRCWVTGWGKNSFDAGGSYQSVLKEVDVPMVPPDVCESKLKRTKLGPFFKLDPGFLCAGGEVGKDACTGDGGSPLVCESNDQWYVVGLVSWGVGCGQDSVPGVYVDMAHYLPWIESIILR